MKMKMNAKTIFGGLAAAGLVLGLSTAASAALTGTCDGCHTMHNSQDGDPIVAAGPQKQLLAFDGCGGCHADGVANTGTGTPRVDETAVGFLAGGYFDKTNNNATAWAKEHNVIDLGISQDAAFTNPLLPPGSSVALATQLSCSGTTGCHTSGGHHTNAGGTLDGSTATSAGESYRFLQTQGGAYISGIEAADWEYSQSNVNHNQYFGQDVVPGTNATNANTMSALCGGCHTDFHGATATDIYDGSDWIRHPTELDLSSAGGEHTSYTTYNIEVPVASDTLADGVQVTLQENAVNDAIVTCVSCHRAHGSDQDDLLRWEYAKMDAGTTTVGSAATGCFRCHSAKDGV